LPARFAGSEERIMLHLNLEKAMSLVADVIDREGETRVYERPDPSVSCLYVHRDKDGSQIPGCIVGHALMDYGISADHLEDQIMEVTELADRLHRTRILSVDDDALNYLSVLQARQDDGFEWGKADAIATAYIQGHDL
jgi:hypothetical protein